MLEEEIEINVDGWNLMVFSVKMRRYKLGFFAKFLTLAVWYVWPTIQWPWMFGLFETKCGQQ